MSIILVFCLILACAIPAFAEESDSKDLEKAIMAVKNVVNIPSDYKEFNYSSSQYEKDGSTVSVWYLNWNKEDNSAGISITVDKNGYLISFQKYIDQQNEGLGNITREAGKITALNFLTKARPDIAGNMRLVENTDYSNTYRHYYSYRLYNNDVAVNFVQLSIEVDKYTGEVVSFNGLEPEIKLSTLPSKSGVIEFDKAKKAYLDNIGIKLRYYSDYDYKKKTLTIFPAYSAVDVGSKAIDAKSGEVVTLYQDYYGYDMGGMGGYPKMANESASAQNALTKEELAAINNVSDLMSKEKAESILRNLVSGITSDMKVTNASLSKNYIEPNKYIWEIGFDGAYGMINAKTGELVSFYIYKEDSRKGNAGISEAKAKEKAEQYIKQIAAEKFQQSKYNENNGYIGIYRDSAEITEYSFNYYRQVNGIDFTSNSFTVTVNKDSGMITQYNCNWYDDVTFPNIDKVISEEAAFEIISKTGNFGLIYKKVDKGDIALVYDFVDPIGGFLIDPINGTKIGWDGKPFKEMSMPEYSDIKGHWCETTVNKLLENGYYLKGEKFNPNHKITQLNFLRYLYAPMQSYYDDEEFYKMLINDKIVMENEKAPNTELTRQDAAKFIVRYLGQGKTAEHPEIFINPYKDKITASYKGYAAVSYGLKIIQGDSKGRFNGTKILTNAEAASLIYKTLQVK